ncbi:MAG: PAS domain S-box protein [Pirellulaceae bacterium]
MARKKAAEQNATNSDVQGKRPSANKNLAIGDDVLHLSELPTPRDVRSTIEAMESSSEELQSLNEQLRAILNAASDAIITIDQRGIIKSVNPATEQMFGYRQGDLIGQNVKILMPPPYCDEHDEYLTRYLETGEARIIGSGRELVGRHKDRSTFPVGLVVSEVEHLKLFIGIIRDMSAVKELQKQVLEIAGEEDRRIGHELHDNIQQQLTGLGMLAKTVADRLTAEGTKNAGLSKTAHLATKIAQGIDEATKQVHLLSHGLVPVEVDAEGLRSALTDLAARVTEQYGVQCDFLCERAVAVEDNFVATHMVRIAQEAINNAIKHGRANRIEISLAEVNETTTLKVLDNGSGIGEKREGGLGMGLRNMQYRAGLIGATVQVAPGQCGGTQVVCTLLRRGSSR